MVGVCGGVNSVVSLNAMLGEDGRATSGLPLRERRRCRVKAAPLRGKLLHKFMIVLTLSAFRSLPLLSDLRGTLSGARSQAPSVFSHSTSKSIGGRGRLHVYV